MNHYNPHIHHRRSIRLKGYDYAQAGLYFVTICIKTRECLLGDITNGKLALNDAGRMVEKWYHELENKFPDIRCHEMVVMPNHFHCIIENVGADLRVCHDEPHGPFENGQSDKNADSINGQSIENTNSTIGQSRRIAPTAGSPLHRVVQWFKTMTTNDYIRGVKTQKWQPFDGTLWQRNYWEHIIRNEKSYQTITEYIINNPVNWEKDKLYH